MQLVVKCHERFRAFICPSDPCPASNFGGSAKRRYNKVFNFYVKVKHFVVFSAIILLKLFFF